MNDREKIKRQTAFINLVNSTAHTVAASFAKLHEDIGEEVMWSSYKSVMSRFCETFERAFAERTRVHDESENKKPAVRNRYRVKRNKEDCWGNADWSIYSNHDLCATPVDGQYSFPNRDAANDALAKLVLDRQREIQKQSVKRSTRFRLARSHLRPGGPSH